MAWPGSRNLHLCLQHPSDLLLVKLPVFRHISTFFSLEFSPVWFHKITVTHRGHLFLLKNRALPPFPLMCCFIYSCRSKSGTAGMCIWINFSLPAGPPQGFGYSLYNACFFPPKDGITIYNHISIYGPCGFVGLQSTHLNIYDYPSIRIRGVKENWQTVLQ